MDQRFASSLPRPFVSALVLIFALASAEAYGETPAVPADRLLPRLPEPVSSFGATVDGGALYVYSGHIGDAHAHSAKNLSHRFQRLMLAGAGGWESLPVGPALQSPALLSHRGMIYRVGGLAARNEPGKPEDLTSVTEFARFDPQQRTWTPLTPLPAGRSSHDAVVVGSRLYVIGGWNLGPQRAWHSTALSIDLADDQAAWIELPLQPFRRRALAVAEIDGKILAIGGMNSEDEPSREVAIFDVNTRTWSSGPDVPGAPMNGFGCSACVAGGALYLSGMDGRVYRLSGDFRSWKSVGVLQQSRFFHRLLPAGTGSLLAIGGASPAGHLDTIERFLLEGTE